VEEDEELEMGGEGITQEYNFYIWSVYIDELDLAEK